MQQEKSLRVEIFPGSIIADITPVMLFMDIFIIRHWHSLTVERSVGNNPGG